MERKKILVADVEPLIEEHHGNVSVVAKVLGVTRQTVYNRIKESTTLQAKLRDARQTMIDNAESSLYNQVLDGNTTAIIFFLKTQAKDRGYVERQEQEITGAGGGPVETVTHVNVKSLSDDELDTLGSVAQRLRGADQGTGKA